MLLKTVISKIPLLQCLTYFPPEVHKSALKKFIVLLILTSLPVIFAAVLSPIPEGEAGAFSKLLSKLRESITVSELFVYSAAFLTPILYLHYERYSDIPKSELKEKLLREVKGIFAGYGFVALIALLLILFTAIAFSNIKTEAANFKSSFLHYYLVKYSLIVYVFSLYCWYLTLLDEKSSGNFVSTNRRTEDDVASAFSARLKERGMSQ